MKPQQSASAWMVVLVLFLSQPVLAHHSFHLDTSLEPELAFKEGVTHLDPSFTCPPCGCSGDQKMSLIPGFCQECGMKLFQMPTGEQGKIARFFSGFFRDSDWTGMYYQKFMYPAYVLGFLLGLVLIVGPRRNPGNIFLGLILLALSLYAFKNQLYGVSYGLTEDFNFLFFPISFLALIGPSLYFYLNLQINPDRKFTESDMFHFAPALIIFCLYAYLFFQENHIKNAFLISPFDIGFAHYEQVLSIVLILGYGYLGCRKMGQERRANNSELFQSQNQYVWCQRLSWSVMALFIGLGFVIWVNYRYYDLGVSILTYYPVWLFIAVFLYLVMFQLFADPNLFFNTSGMLRKKDPGYTRSLGEDEISYYQVKLLEVMDSQKPYLDSTLSLNKLGDLLEINAKDLTVVLNSGLNKNFYDFVNEYRIREVKGRLLDPRNRYYTNLAIAYDAGFNSKSSFNSLFKKYMNMTPSEFKRNAGYSH